MDNNDLTRIESLKRKMYSRQTEGLAGIREHRLRTPLEKVKTDWEPIDVTHHSEKKRSFLTYFLIFSFVFFLAAGGYAAYLYFMGGNVVSPGNIDVVISGPISIRGGDKLSLDISVQNRNATPLQSADLLVEYPDGTRSATDLTKALARESQDLGDVAPGASIKKTVNSVLFGEEQSVKDIKITVEYRVSGSNAIFYKESHYQVAISSAPLSIVVDAPTEATSGQDLSLKVTINSNSPDIVRNVLLSVDYPSGFSFKSSDPKPYSGNSIWKLGDVKPGSTLTYIIRGSLSGENQDTRVFRFTTGIADLKNDHVIGTPFAAVTEQLAIKKPFVGLSLALNGSSDDTVVTQSGKSVRVDITYTNNLLVPVSDVEIALALAGNALDKSSVSADQGFYRSVDNTVIWNKTTSSNLASIAPGQSGTVSVSVSPFSLFNGIVSIRNPQLNLTASVTGRRQEESGSVPEQIVASIKKTVQVETDLGFASRVLYYSGVYKNTGPMPPKAEKETTYTIVWDLTNASNDVSDAVVTAPLPSYVRFVGAQPGQSVAYSAVGGVVTWNVGAVKAGTGYGTPPLEAVFQVALTPSVSQIGQKPVLINDQRVNAVDRFTGATISFTNKQLDTRLSSDSSSKTGDETVVK